VVGAEVAGAKSDLRRKWRQRKCGTEKSWMLVSVLCFTQQTFVYVIFSRVVHVIHTHVIRLHACMFHMHNCTYESAAACWACLYI